MNNIAVYWIVPWLVLAGVFYLARLALKVMDLDRDVYFPLPYKPCVGHGIIWLDCVCQNQS